jgi:acyl transferase domain-containing protein
VIDQAESADQILDDPGTAVAIIGMAGQFPGAPDIASLWKNLVERRDSITRFNATDSEARNSLGTEEARDFVAARGVLDGAALFDAEFFGVNPKEPATSPVP